MIQSLVYTKTWERHGKGYPIAHTSRKASGLMLILGGGQYLYMNGKCQHLVQGDIYFLRRGENYRLELDDDKYIKCYVINFQCDDEMLSFVLNNCSDLSNQFAKIVPLWNNRREGAYNELDCMGLLYRLLAECYRRRYVNNVPRRKKERIAPALAHMQAHYSDQELKVSDLAALCGLGDRAFRRLFHEYTGKSPIEYRNEIRLEEARRLIGTGEYLVEEAANAVGFSNISFFCRCFKKRFGHTPLGVTSHHGD